MINLSSHHLIIIVIRIKIMRLDLIYCHIVSVQPLLLPRVIYYLHLL
jgi:hypothetical protein